jgi:hypothetical protein
VEQLPEDEEVEGVQDEEIQEIEQIQEVEEDEDIVELEGISNEEDNDILDKDSKTIGNSYLSLKDEIIEEPK